MSEDDKVAQVAQVERFFDDPAHYLSGNAVIQLRQSLVRELLGDLTDVRILDIGCGDGTLSLQYADSGCHVALVDASASMLDAARANVRPDSASRITLHQADITSADDLGTDSADRVLCVGVLAHVPEPDATVARLAALVEPGGRLLLQISDYDRPLGKVGYWIARAATRSRHYPLARAGSSGIIGCAGKSGLRLVATSRYPASPPGYRLLPVGVQHRALHVLHSRRFLAPFRTETLLLFEKETT